MIKEEHYDQPLILIMIIIFYYYTIMNIIIEHSRECVHRQDIHCTKSVWHINSNNPEEVELDLPAEVDLVAVHNNHPVINMYTSMIHPAAGLQYHPNYYTPRTKNHYIPIYPITPRKHALTTVHPNRGKYPSRPKRY